MLKGGSMSEMETTGMSMGSEPLRNKIAAGTKAFAFAAFLAVASFNSPAMAVDSVMADNFDDNTTNSLLWAASATGGSAYAEANQRLEIVFPSTSNGSDFGTGYTSRCRLRGDFDVQVDYELLNWPQANGVRIGLGSAGGVVERTSFSSNIYSDYIGWPREVFLTHLTGDGVNGIVETGIEPGKLRLVRQSGVLTGYSFTSDGWVPVHSGYSTTNDSAISLSAWSHNGIFTGREVKLAFDNFVVNQGQPVCQGKLMVPIDIKPGSFPNSINLGSNGNVPVAILSTATFDATQVDPATVTLSGAAVNLNGKGTPMFSIQDVNDDGRIDMLIHITTSALVLNDNDTTAVIEGSMFDGSAIKGSDSVRIVP